MRELALLLFVAVAAARLGLSWLNLRYLEREGHLVPRGLEREVDAARLRKISAYTSERARFGLVHSAASSVATGAFVFDQPVHRSLQGHVHYHADGPGLRHLNEQRDHNVHVRHPVIAFGC